MTQPGDRLATVTYLPGFGPAGDDPVRPGRQSASARSIDARSRVRDGAGLPEQGVLEQGELEHRELEPGELAPDKSARRAQNVSVHALTRRDRSRAELEGLLAARGLDPQAVARELERLERVGLIDDEALARDLVHRLRERKGLGRTAIAVELHRKRLDPEAISAALETVDAEAEFETALRVATDRARQLRSLDHVAAKRRLSAYLARRGYGAGTVRAVVDEVLESGRASGVRFE